MATSVLQPNGTYTLSATPSSTSAPVNGEGVLNSSYNPGTNAGGSSSSLTNPDTVSSSVPDTGSELSDTLNSQFAPTQNTIMQNYAAANSALTANAANTTKSITDTGNYNLGYENTQDKNLGTQMQEGSSGFVTNPGAIVSLQTQADKRVRDLTTQMNDALASNNSSLATSLAQNIADEQTAITNARTTFLNQYFGSQQEARSEASFQTPEQTSVLALASQYPDAGITPTDSLASAQQKLTGSTLYNQALATGKANISSANASATASLAGAGLSSAQTAQLNTVLSTLKNSGSYDQDVSGLLTGASTDATLHAKYDNYPGGLGGAIIASIETQAQAKGWNPQSSSLNASGQKSLTDAQNSGNPFTLIGAGATTLLDNIGSKLFGNSTPSNPFSLTQGTKNVTPSGISYTISQ